MLLLCGDYSMCVCVGGGGCGGGGVVGVWGGGGGAGAGECGINTQVTTAVLGKSLLSLFGDVPTEDTEGGEWGGWTVR